MAVEVSLRCGVRLEFMANFAVQTERLALVGPDLEPPEEAVVTKSSMASRRRGCVSMLWGEHDQRLGHFAGPGAAACGK